MDVGPMLGPFALAVSELHEQIEMPLAALAQQRIFHHICQRWRDGECELERRPLVPQLIKELDQRNIRFRDSLEEPALFEEAVILGMANVGQVCVQDEE